MAQVVVRVPQIKWRTDKLQVPDDKVEVVRAALRAQQERINEQLMRRNEEVLRRLAKATAPKKQRGVNLKAVLALSLGALLGLAAGVVFVSRSERARQMVGERAGQAIHQAQETAQKIQEKAPIKRPSGAGRPEVMVDAGTVTENVQAALGEDEVLKGVGGITASAEPGGIVYLRGSVPTENERSRAETIARGTSGVTEVINELSVESGPMVQ